jgi:hypothetical protein
MRKWFSFFIVFFFSSYIIHALDIRISQGETGFDVRGEYNRVFDYCQDMMAFGSIELNDRFCFGMGAAFGFIGNELDIKAFGSTSFSLLRNKTLNLNLAYIYNNIPGFQMQSQTILPYISYGGRWAGIAAGISFRFSRFFNEDPLFEPVLSFSAYANFLKNKKTQAGIKCVNFNKFYAGNMGSYTLSLNGTWFFSKQASLVGEIVLLQSGSVGLSATLYGLACQLGMRFLW